MRITSVGWLTAITLSTAACHTLRPVTLDELNAFKPSEVRVTRADQSVVVVSSPQLLGDTLVGYVQGKFEEMPTVNLTQFVMKKPDKAKTTALIIGATVGIAGAALMLTSGGSFVNPADTEDCEDDPEKCTMM